MTSAQYNTRKEQTLQSIFDVQRRPSRPNGWSASMTFSWRALLKIKYLPEQLFDVTAFPIISLLMFTYLFGGAVAGSTVDYLQYLLPGILVMTVTMVTTYTGLDLNKDISRGIFDRFRTLPIWRPSVLVGALLVDAIRYSIASILIISLGLLLGFRPEGGVLGVIFAVLLLLVFAFSLSWIWTSLSLIMRTDKSLMNTSMMVLLPLTFISNVFVDPATMPSWLQAFVVINPITLLATAIRGLMLGTASAEQIVWAHAASIIVLAIFSPLTMYLYRNKK